MRHDPRAFLWDALSAAEAIQGFVQNRDAGQYAADELLHSAVERKFEIIGEALGQLASPRKSATRRGAARLVANVSR